MKGLNKSGVRPKSSHETSRVSVKMRKAKEVATDGPPSEVSQNKSFSKSSSPGVSPRMRMRTNSCVVPPLKQQLSLPPQRNRSSSFGQISLHKAGSSSPTKRFTKRHDSAGKNNDSSLESLPTHGNVFHHTSETPNNDLIFDYLHGEIRHKTKTAFGSTVHEENQVKSSPKPTKKVSLANNSDSGDDVSAESETLTADNFLNQCIIESEQKCVKAAEKPHSSAAFDAILKEFMADNDLDTEREQTQQLFRPRRYSLPSTSLLKTANGSAQSQKKVQILLPEI